MLKPQGTSEASAKAAVHQPASPAPDQPTWSAKAGTEPAGRGLFRGAPAAHPPAIVVPALPDLSPYVELRIVAESYADVQAARIACTNRMERGGVDADLFAPQLEALQLAEHEFKLALGRTYRRVVRTTAPGIDAWQQATAGIGTHLLARLLGALGHPAIATPFARTTDPPLDHVCDPLRCGKGEDDKAARHLVAKEAFVRTPRRLFAYCGYGDPALKRAKGMSQADALKLGNPHAKMILHLLAEAAIKQPGATSSPEPGRRTEANEVAAPGTPSSPPENLPTAVHAAEGKVWRYRPVYDKARAEYSTRDDWTLGHQHAAALRRVAKEILRDLWLAADGPAFQEDA